MPDTCWRENMLVFSNNSHFHCHSGQNLDLSGQFRAPLAQCHLPSWRKHPEWAREVPRLRQMLPTHQMASRCDGHRQEGYPQLLAVHQVPGDRRSLLAQFCNEMPQSCEKTQWYHLPALQQQQKKQSSKCRTTGTSHNSSSNHHRQCNHSSHS